MADAKSTVPGKVQVTYPNGIVLLKRKDGTIRIFDGDGDIVAEGKIIETQRDGTVIFISKYGSKMQLDPDGSMTLKPKETPSNLIPAPNIR